MIDESLQSNDIQHHSSVLVHIQVRRHTKRWWTTTVKTTAIHTEDCILDKTSISKSKCYLISDFDVFKQHSITTQHRYYVQCAVSSHTQIILRLIGKNPIWYYFFAFINKKYDKWRYAWHLIAMRQSNVELLLGQRLRLWSSNKTASDLSFVSAAEMLSLSIAITIKQHTVAFECTKAISAPLESSVDMRRKINCE